MTIKKNLWLIGELNMKTLHTGGSKEVGEKGNYGTSQRWAEKMVAIKVWTAKGTFLTAGK